MKPKNFPARKLARQLLAMQRKNGEVRPFSTNELKQIYAAQEKRSKKYRARVI